MFSSQTYLEDLASIVKTIPDYQKLFHSSILVTGSNGLICSALVDFLYFLNKKYDAHIDIYASGRSVQKLEKRFYSFLNDDYFHIFKYDVSDPLVTDEKIDYIIHGASPANPGQYSTIPVETMMINIAGTKHVLEYAKEHDVKRMLYISSSEVYGNKKDTNSYSENEYGYVNLLNPRSCYPSAKRACETLCASYNKEYNVDYVIIRPGHIYGPTMTSDDNRASSQFPKDITSGHDIVMKSKGNQLRSYCYVLDCVSALLTVLLKGENGNAYNISNKNSVVTIREMAEAFAQAGERKVVFDFPSEEEKNSYNMMDNSSLNSEKLESLGWKGMFDIHKGTLHTLQCLNEKIKERKNIQ